MSNNKTGAAIGALIFFVIMIAFGAWVFSLYQEQNRYVAEGCIPMVWGSLGLATSMVCPGQAGYEAALLSN